MKNLDRIRKQLSPERRRKITVRAAEIMAEEMTRQELRRARKLTQVHLAKRLRITQDGVSRLEQRTDLLLSTLRGYVEALGGRLSLVVEFPDREPVILSGIAEGQPDPKPIRRTRISHVRAKDQRSRTETTPVRMAQNPGPAAKSAGHLPVGWRQHRP